MADQLSISTLCGTQLEDESTPNTPKERDSVEGRGFGVAVGSTSAIFEPCFIATATVGREFYPEYVLPPRCLIGCC